MPKRSSYKASGRTRVEMVLHDEATRTNIPTSETGGFMTEAQKAPTKVLYPRDSSLDPQLVWKGKDEQDLHPLEVPAVPIYIQEKIHPKALVEALRTEQREGDPQASLFADFNGIQFEELVEFYQHSQHWSNRMILGDSLLVLTSLAEKEGLKGEVQTIYLDPPYGIKFGSNWQVSTRKRDVRDGKVEDATRQPEQVKAFRDTWELGIHSYLTYLRDRLVVARDLLRPSGSVFVQIGDENVHLVRSVLDEIFGSANFLSLITVRKSAGLGEERLSNVCDFVLWYAREAKEVKTRRLFSERNIGSREADHYRSVEEPDGTRRPARAGDDEDPRLRFFRPQLITSQRPAQGGDLRSFAYEGHTYTPGTGTFKTDRGGLERLAAAGRLLPTGAALSYLRYHDDFPVFPLTNAWMDIGGVQSRSDPKIYAVQTANRVIERCILMASDPGDLVIDPTCGAGTTALVSEQWGRRWITIDTSRVALALARQRLMSARLPYYLLVDDRAGGAAPDIRRGFKYRTVPHVTLKSIANNPDVRVGMSRLDMEAAIGRHADQEVLYDQPEEDRSVVRVSGPFTVESLSPHVTLPVPSTADGAIGPSGDEDVERFQRVVLGHLRTAGVQNTVRSERMMFDSLEPWAGTYVHAVGEYRETDQVKRAAICIGPECGTVDADLVRAAAREASGFFDILIVCGFAFDGYIAGELRQLGNLTILKAAMNPDLAMGDELLKKTGAGNLFMVFGEPDIELRATEDGQWEVEVHGVDVYNPTTGEIRSHTTDDIACWFIDTNYASTSFFVRHAYFCGGNQPYEQLQRALRADINEEVWASLYTTTSRAFSRPASGKIAIKVINHYGDEVMKVLEVPS